MQKINTFSEKKFKSLDFEHQIIKILKLIEEIEKTWHETETHLFLLNELKKLFSFIGKKDVTLTQMEKFLETSQISLREFDKYASSIVLKFSAQKGESHFVIYNKDFSRNEVKKFPVYLVLDNLRSSFNVGAIFRTAECFGISKIYCCGYTPLPDSGKLAKSAMGTEKLIDWEHFENTEDAIFNIRKKNIPIYGLELTSKSIDINKFNPDKFFALILGNEALGISESILTLCDKVLYIPLYGNKNSLNVTSAAAVAINELIKKIQ